MKSLNYYSKYNLIWNFINLMILFFYFMFRKVIPPFAQGLHVSKVLPRESVDELEILPLRSE